MSRYFPAAGSDFLLLYPSACVNPSPPGGGGVPLESSGDKAFARVFSGVKPLCENSVILQPPLETTESSRFDNYEADLVCKLFNLFLGIRLLNFVL